MDALHEKLAVSVELDWSREIVVNRDRSTAIEIRLLLEHLIEANFQVARTLLLKDLVVLIGLDVRASFSQWTIDAVEEACLFLVSAQTLVPSDTAKERLLIVSVLRHFLVRASLSGPDAPLEV